MAASARGSSTINPFAAVSNGSAGEEALARRQAGVLVGSMFLAYALNYCDRQAVFSIYPVLKSELHFSNAELGMIGSAFTIIYGLCSPLAGWIGDRVSQKTLVLLSLVLWSGFTVLTGIAASVIVLLCCRALIGISESLFMPSAIALTGSAYPPRARSRAVGLLKSSQIFGVVAGGWFGGIMADHGRWREAFYVLGAVGIAYALPYHLCLRQYRQPIHAETRSSGGLAAVSVLARIPSYFVIGTVFAIESFGLWLIYAWLPTFFREKFSMSMAEAALSANVWLQAATFAGIVGGGWVADRLCVRRKAVRLEMIGWGMLLCFPCLHLLGHCDSLAATKGAAVGLGLGTGWVMANVFPAAFDVVPVDTRSSSVGWLNFFSAIGAFPAPFLGGLLKQSLGLGNLMSLTGGLYAAGGLVMFAGAKIWFGRDYDRVH